MRSTLLCLLLLPLSALAADGFLFENVRLIDVDGNHASEPVSLAVREGFIVHSEQLGEAPVRIEAEGFLMPGLAEMHAHIPPTRDPERLADVLTLFLAHGVTTVRGMLGEAGHLPLRAELANGERHGPRLLTAGPSFNGNTVSSPEQAAGMVRAQSEAGYDLLKLHPGLWPDAFAAIVETAAGLGIDYSGHVSMAVGLDRVLASQQGTIDHLDAYVQAMVPERHPLYGRDPGFFGMNLVDGIDDSRIEALALRTAEAGIANVPTQTLLENIFIGDLDALLGRPAMRFVNARTRDNWLDAIEQLREGHGPEQRQRFIDVRRALILALHRAGATILLGADAPQILNVPGDAVHHELELYVAAGLSPAEALATGTTRVADYLGQSAHGCLQPGCVADLVLLTANPLADIHHSRSIQGVMRAGRWYDRAALDEMLEDVARRAADD
ncbi:amidohydrolase family protein [Wenzhouxiangella marina]|uniref:Amidohydrolase n=1 Tax=Wenzhouxiangella marina TaxID=1579979 RepID=A0A0K0XYR9_9GAMM|nr:amidohydrolase family protein [Wenzhouxiangella marina]AKS42833.1 amidohydrolase [Wenzhouxiangella marina]MBB6087487.1 hypothetical protein [Wenzhouxiangella marina]